MIVNLKILKTAFVSASHKCDNLKEKELVKKMLLRRRLTRGAKIAIYLASEVDYDSQMIVFGTAYGEVQATASIVESIYNKSLLSPTAFQNSVHNTPVSYLSLVSQNRGEIVTVSDLEETSLSILKVGAIKALTRGKILLLNVDAFEFDKIDEINRCGATQLESGVSMLVEVTKDKANIEIENIPYEEFTPSLWQMLEIYHKSKKIENPVVRVEI